MVAYIFSQSQHLGDKGRRLRNWRLSIFINSKFEARLGFMRWSQNHWWETDLAIFKLPWKPYKLVIGSYKVYGLDILLGIQSTFQVCSVFTLVSCLFSLSLFLCYPLDFHCTLSSCHAYLFTVFTFKSLIFFRFSFFLLLHMSLF